MSRTATRIAYVLLCHKDPEGVIAQARRLTAAGDFLAIHFDASAPRAAWEMIRRALRDQPGVALVTRRLRCGWGEWSLVEASLRALRLAEARFPEASHFYMLSGDCMPIKSAQYMHEFLGRESVDLIESFDFHNSDWIKTGIREERLIYRHWFNERRSKRLFYASMALQKRLGLERPLPADLQIMIGSQWWCLRRTTVERLLKFCDRRPDVLRFFRTTWIPDETFFQTLVRHLVPEAQIRSRTPTFLIFTDYGMPVTFHSDHYSLLLTQDYLFARKISEDAPEMRSRLGALYAAEGMAFPIANQGREQFHFLTGRGRVGRRFAPRFWEVEGSIGRDRQLFMITSKKWHVAKRLAARIRAELPLHAVNYLFDEADTPLPDLGGIQSTLEKRTRHRRALMRLLFDYWKTDRLLFCIDPASVDLMQDFYNDKAQVRLLEIDCRFGDDYLIGHARRVGLASEHSPPEAIASLLPTIRHDLDFERDHLREQDFPDSHRICETNTLGENSRALAAFLAIPEATAQAILAPPGLFAD